ncbi:hypothetical protein DC347_18160 [Pseudarthrobacter sp. AG30]|uniref:hypothetical protein n=1 Tax=unclassified Pseudarthrobacter TaxID=2647000 RepID=UPI000D6E53A7|nr:hypothetical protein [Pseudarthrobacter sp. AG30]RAX15296.1 hypothetical protein DC347_18160 [Pseudarthrobacter sp. AG30]
MSDKEEMPRMSEAVPVTGAGGPQMPLGARRLFIIGSLGVLAGIVAGRFYFSGLVLAVAGIALLGVALSYRDKKPWMSPISWVVCVAGGLWTAITAAYGWSISTEADAASSHSEFAGWLFTSGYVMFVVMAIGVASAVVVRIIRRRPKAHP